MHRRTYRYKVKERQTQEDLETGRQTYRQGEKSK